MKKNYKLVVWIETDLKEKLDEQAKKENISTSEICRRKLIRDTKIIFH